MYGPRRTALLVVLALAVITVGCGVAQEEQDRNRGGATITSPIPSETETPASRTVAVTLRDFEIGLDSDTVDHGEVTFTIRNEGPSEHEFVIVETAAGVGSGDLPMTDGAVNEESLEVVDEQESIGVGDEEELTVNLAAGDYIVFCNIDGHYRSGMHQKLTVR